MKRIVMVPAPLCLAMLFALGWSTPAGAQVIRACVNPAGQLRLIGAADTCRSQEMPGTWARSGEGRELEFDRHRVEQGFSQ